MQHIKPMGKGDALCPLGFHPQVRWPTRCKRCFRDYKEHGNRNKEQDNRLKKNDTTASSPSLSSWSSRTVENKNNDTVVTRSWTSTTNLNENNNQQPKCYETINSNKKTSSWTSTPDLVQSSDNSKNGGEHVASATLPRRKQLVVVNDRNSDDDYRRTSYTVRRRTNFMKQPSMELHVHENIPSAKTESVNFEQKISFCDTKEDTESDIFTDAVSSINTNETKTTVNDNFSQEQIENLTLELENMKMRYEKAEKEKNDMLMRRVAYLDNSLSTKTTTSELSRFQQKINNLTETCENLKDERKALLSRIQELENNNKSNRSSIVDSEINILKSKLQAAESLCEELMDENEEIKRELKGMEEEIEEMQDNFRESEADEYSSIKKELEQTGKNCRILSFKLRKCERKAEQLEAEKFESERKSREAIQKLQKELDEVNEKLRLDSIEGARKKAPMLGNIPRTPSGEKVSRTSLTRGGSQDDPVQLLRDLQDSIEREADLREQLRYAEEEAQNLRKKVSRVEDDNESLLMQLKKMATKAKSCKSSPTHSRLNKELSIEKDEGISDDDDPTELRLLLELNEQESAVLRKKVEELEENCDILKRKTSDLQEKLLSKEQKVPRTSKQKDFAKAEEELHVLKNKLHEKEQECNQLNGELNTFKKNSKATLKTRSSSGDDDSIDLRRQLKVVEQEAGILRARICSLETENEKLQNENKQLGIAKISKKSEADLKCKIISLEKQLSHASKLKLKNSDDKCMNEIKELQKKCLLLESENSKLMTSLKLLKDGNTEEIKEFFRKRKPKIVTDSTSKVALKRMIEDLECEIEEILLLQEKRFSEFTKNLNEQSNTEEKKLLNEEIEKMKQKLEIVSKEYEEEKLMYEKEKEKLLNEKRKLEKDLKDGKIKEREFIENEKEKLIFEIKELQLQMSHKDKELQKIQNKQTETCSLLSAAHKKLEEENCIKESLKYQLESIQNYAKEEEKLKCEIESIKNENDSLKILQKEQCDKFKENEKELKNKIEELTHQSKVKSGSIYEKQKKIKHSETLMTQKSINSDKKETSNVKISELQNKLSKALKEIQTLTEKLKTLENEKKTVEAMAEATSNRLKIDIAVLKKNAEKLQNDFEAERTSMKQYKEDQIKQLLSKDTELKEMKKRMLNLNDKKVDEITLETLKNELNAKQEEYEELTGKYELLEDEHVKLKSQANLQKEQLQSQLVCCQKELISAQNELRTLRETYNNEQDHWIKEKLNLEEKIKELENHLFSEDSHTKLELNKVKLMLEVKESELEKLQKDKIIHVDQLNHMRKTNDELQKKLDDFDKVIKVQHNMVADASSLETELRELKTKLHNEEKGRKVEIAALKLRYENHIATISEEQKDIQAQLARFKHERNTYKQLLENQQKNADIKIKKDIRTSSTSEPNDNEELQNQIATLEQQISCMDDELSEARIESSRLKAELVSEKSAWDIKLSEMTSRINELEEERLLHSGRTKTAGLKTRMELSWQKEREEQNRLLQETSTLARDLRQTLFEVERERDKERFEMKRRIEQTKKNAEEEQEEMKNKLHELQRDLLELRDAHAKLRTTNEKLRREKELIRQNIRQNPFENEQKNINYILDLINDLSNSISHNDKSLPPVPKKQKIPTSRESSAEMKNISRESSVSKEDPKMQFQNTLQKLIDVGRQIRANQNTVNSLSFNRDSAKKAFVSRRPASTESDKINDNTNTLQRRGSLYRKCISLEQTSQSVEAYEPIWRMDEDTDSSIVSFQSIDDIYCPKMNYKYDQSFDSRLSGGSTHSEMLPATYEKKKKKGFLDKLKKLTKSSRSIDDDTDKLALSCLSQVNAGSNNSTSKIIPNREFVPKKDLKGRITNLFKTSDYRNNSMERFPSKQSNESIDGSTLSDMKITESQTLPRRTVSSEATGTKIGVEANRGGATMPRLHQKNETSEKNEKI